jgi:hypothetical protein
MERIWTFEREASDDISILFDLIIDENKKDRKLVKEKKTIELLFEKIFFNCRNN